VEALVENRDGVYVVTLRGHMNFESADALKTQCLKNFLEKEVILNLRELNFVGSSGITPFLEMLSALAQSNGTKLKICSVSTEFMRLFETGHADGIEIYQDIIEAHRAFYSPDVQAIARLKPFGLKLTID